MANNQELRRGWKIIASAAVGLATGPSIFLMFSFGVFATPLQNEFGWSRSEVMFGLSLMLIGLIVASPLQGWLSDRYGARRVILVSMPTFAFGLWLMTQVPANRSVYYAVCVLLPFFGVGLWPMTYLRMMSSWFNKHLGMAIGLANGGIGIGAMLIPVAATAWIAQYGWRVSFVIMAGIVVCVSWPVIAWFLRDPEQPVNPGMASAPSAAAQPPVAEVTFSEIIKTRKFMLLGLAFLLLGVFSSIAANQVPMFMDAGVTAERAALVAAVFGLGISIARVGVGMLLDYVPFTLVMVLCCIAGVLGTLIYGTAPHSASVFVAAILVATVLGAEFDVLSFVITRHFSIGAFGRIYGVVFSIFQLGNAVGVMVLPLSHSHLGSYTPGLWVLCISLVLAGICFVVFGRGIKPGHPRVSAAH